MVVAGRQKSIAFIAMGAGLITGSLLLYIGWVLLNWRTGWMLFLGILLLGCLISGVVLNTIFLVREIRRNEQHDAFINAVSHELKTPVTSIRLYLETLQKRAVDEDKRQEFYRNMLVDSERLLASIEQILRTGRMGASSPKPHRTPLDFREEVEWCLGRARALHQYSAEAIEYVPGPRSTILADADEVRAAVSNLIDNALKYSGPGKKITVRTDADDAWASVLVTDRGPGIPKPELKRIFKRFYRVPGPLAARIKGTGLGLYIVRSVARRHDGRVWAESDGLGYGSTFVLQLPLINGAARERSREA